MKSPFLSVSATEIHKQKDVKQIIGGNRKPLTGRPTITPVLHADAVRAASKQALSTLDERAKRGVDSARSQTATLCFCSHNFMFCFVFLFLHPTCPAGKLYSLQI